MRGKVAAFIGTASEFKVFFKNAVEVDKYSRGHTTMYVYGNATRSQDVKMGGGFVDFETLREQQDQLAARTA